MQDKIETVNIKGKQHPTYAGVLKKAHEEGLKEIRTELLQAPLEVNNYMAIVHARVTTERGVFEGIGDATPKNVNSMIAPHIVRMAETRAKGRALRDALNIAEALAEELGEYSQNYGMTDKDEMNGYEDEPTQPDELDHAQKQLLAQRCKKCGGEMVKNPKNGNIFCKAKCWLN